MKKCGAQIPEKRRLIYILAPSYTGSTLLTLLLSNHKDIFHHRGTEGNRTRRSRHIFVLVRVSSARVQFLEAADGRNAKSRRAF
jgi:hypothetical protein